MIAADPSYQSCNMLKRAFASMIVKAKHVKIYFSGCSVFSIYMMLYTIYMF